MVNTAKNPKNTISFKKIPIPSEYGPTKYTIYHVLENDRPLVMIPFNKIPESKKTSIKALICRMATISNYNSPIITRNIHGYNFGEIRPMPHRFFFFQKCGNNIIFFGYIKKKKDKLPDKIYKNLDKDKRRYEEEFKRYFESSR